MSNDQRAASRESGVRQRPPRVLSEEQQIMLELRAKVNATENNHRWADLNVIKENRQKNGDTLDLMVAFNNVAPHRDLYTVQKVYEVLVKGGVEKPSSILDKDAMEVALDVLESPKGFTRGWGPGEYKESTAKLVAYVLLSGEYKHVVANIVKERNINDVESLKPIIDEVKGKASSLGSGVL